MAALATLYQGLPFVLAYCHIVSCAHSMTLFVFGINHHNSPVHIREQVAFAPEATPSAMQRMLHETTLQEVAILSTCNRTEIYAYCVDEPPQDASISEQMSTWLAQFHGLPVEQINQYSYCHIQEAAAKHMMRVASGLDSLVLGEPQILGQLKSCFSVATEHNTLSNHLYRLFQQSFTVAKQVRTQTAIGENPVSVAYAAVTMARQIFTDFSQQTALLIGAGETIELAARHLQEAGIKQLLIANRTLNRAEQLAQEFNAQALLLSDIPEYLPQADIVVSSTASQLPILGKGMVERALKERKHRFIYMVDIAVPRDIEPEVGTLDDVYLYSIDDLKDVIDQGKRSRQKAAIAAESIIEKGLVDYAQKEKSLDAVAIVRDYRQKMEMIRDNELGRAIANLNKGQDTQKVLQRLARDLSIKMMHGPTMYLKKASMEDQEQSLQIVQDMFELNK